MNMARGLLTFSFHFIFIVERDKDFSHQRRHYKEFRFDLTQIPHGEAVTAAEFRIYKDRSYSRFENETIKISIYQIIKEYPNRSLFLSVVLQINSSSLGTRDCFLSVKESNHSTKVAWKLKKNNQLKVV